MSIQVQTFAARQVAQNVRIFHWGRQFVQLYYAWAIYELAELPGHVTFERMKLVSERVGVLSTVRSTCWFLPLTVGGADSLEIS